MDEMREKFAAAVSGKLSAAPDSAAKAELIEELSENLYQRYQDMVSDGVDDGEAFLRAMDDLGDAGELVDYLKGLAPDEPLPGPEQSTASQLDDLLKDVEAIVSGALERAKSAIREAKETVQESGAFNWKSDDGQFELHLDQDGENAQENAQENVQENAQENVQEDAQETVQEDGREPSGEQEARPGGSHGWEFSVGYDSDEGRFFAGGSPRGTGTVYGFGYDKAKGGFYTQWGQDEQAPCAEEEAASVDPIPSDALRGIELVVDGDVTIRMDEDPDGDVVIGGDVEDLEVRRSDDGVLTIRQGKTASSSFFFRRGLSSADVELSLPCRGWDFLRISAGSGDVEIRGGGEVEQLSVKTMSGDLTGGIARCGELTFRSASGSASWEGPFEQGQLETTSGDIELDSPGAPCGRLCCKSASGDIRFDGQARSVQASGMSGEVELAGAFTNVRCTSMSGDVRLESSLLPKVLELSSKSGDCEVRVPDNGPFSVNFKTISGSCRSDFFAGFLSGRGGTFCYEAGDSGLAGPVYHMSTVSGDLRLLKY